MASFLAYHEPSIVQLLILISFFYVLSLSTWTASKLIYASIIGPSAFCCCRISLWLIHGVARTVTVGIIFGTPLGNILLIEWQQTFLSLGYIGLLLIIFAGGLDTRLDLLKANIFASLTVAATGSMLPIAFSYLLLYLGFGYGSVETFIVGASLSATSLGELVVIASKIEFDEVTGTTLAVFSSTKDTHDLQQTTVGTVLVSAAIIDDVAALVMLRYVASDLFSFVAE